MLNTWALYGDPGHDRRIQVYVTQDRVPAETLEAIKHWIWRYHCAEGLCTLRQSDLYVRMTSVQLLTKSLRPLPDKHLNG